MPRPTIKQYEWDNRLGTTSYNLNMQGKNLRGFAETFSDKIQPPQLELLEKLANSAEQLGTMVSELEDEIHK